MSLVRLVPRSRNLRKALTIGWGSATYGDGVRVRQGDRNRSAKAFRYSQELADALLAGRLGHDWRSLRDCIPVYKALTVNRQAALLSFTYNCGPCWFGAKGLDTLTQALRCGALETVPAALWSSSLDQVSTGSPDQGRISGLLKR